MHGIKQAREDQLMATSEEISSQVKEYFQTVTRAAIFFSGMYNASFAADPEAAPKYYKDNCGISTWSKLVEKPFLASLLVGHARRPDYVKPEDPGCNFDFALLSATYKSGINPLPIRGASGTVQNASVGSGPARIKCEAIEGLDSPLDPLKTKKVKFEVPCSAWMGNGEVTWVGQKLPGSWAKKDSGIRSFRWCRGYTVMGMYPNEALYKKLFFPAPGPHWAPTSAFGALSLRISGTILPSDIQDPTVSPTQILERVANHTNLSIVLFILTEWGELLACSAKGQQVERRIPWGNAGYSRLVGLVRADDPETVQEPVRTVAAELMRHHCTSLLTGSMCSWRQVPRLHRIGGYVVTAKWVTDPLADGLDMLLVSMFPEHEVLKQSHELNALMSMLGLVILTVASTLAILLSCAITTPLRIVRDSMSLLGAMKIDDAMALYKSRTFSRCKFSELHDLRSSFEVAAGCLAVWRDDEIARRQHLEDEKQLRITRTIQMAEEADGKLLHPMVLVSASYFLQMKDFASYEHLRDAGRLVFLDTERALSNFQVKHTIVFISHQWLSWEDPDPEKVHFLAMKSAIRQLSKTLGHRTDSRRCDLENMFAWVDYCSIAQRHRGTQTLAISSLPTYAASADAFVIIAPTAKHSCPGRVCNLQTYNSRGWCRAEVLAKVCSTGLDNFFVLDSPDGMLQQISATHLNNLPLNVFDGCFSCCEQGHRNNATCDKETLVVAVLGLYSRVLRHLASGVEAHDHMSPEIPHIFRFQQHFFPKTFMFQSFEGWTEERELFGTLACALEMHIYEETNSKYLEMHLDRRPSDEPDHKCQV